MQVTENHSLKSLNTFGVDAHAQWFAEVSTVRELEELLSEPRWRSVPKLALGGGSNILFTNDFDGLVIHNIIKGIEVVREETDFVLLRAGGGEGWHDLVMHAVERNWGGIENLSLIPGYVGAAPIQNIGAYGAELSEVFDSLEAVDLHSREMKQFSPSECRFGYRYSVFKGELKDRFMITAVTLRLYKKPEVNTNYGAVKETLQKTGVTQPTIRDVSNAVINIRRSKLPDPAEIGNAGSFFKNPVVSEDIFTAIQAKYPDAPSYPQQNGQVKIPAGWLIEHAGWKGKRLGSVGMHERQALVLVNYGEATGAELHSHAMRVKQSVSEIFRIELEEEVRVV